MEEQNVFGGFIHGWDFESVKLYEVRIVLLF